MYSTAAQPWAPPSPPRAPSDSLLLEAFFAACRNPSAFPCSRQLAARRSVAGLGVSGGSSASVRRRRGCVKVAGDPVVEASGAAEDGACVGNREEGEEAALFSACGKRPHPPAQSASESGVFSSEEGNSKPTKKARRPGEDARNSAALEESEAGLEALLGVESGGDDAGSVLSAERRDSLLCGGGLGADAFPLTVSQREDLCLALITALGRLRPQWRRRGGRIPFQLHFSRLRPSLLQRNAGGGSFALPCYVDALRPLVEIRGTAFEFCHLSTQDALQAVWEVQALQGPDSIDAVTRALDSLHAQFLPSERQSREAAGSSSLTCSSPEDGAKAEEEVVAAGEAPSSPRRACKASQQEFPSSLSHVPETAGAASGVSSKRELSPSSSGGGAPAVSGQSRPSASETLTLAYDPDLRTMRQLNYLVSGTRVFVLTQVLNERLAQAGLPLIPPPPLPAEGVRGSLSSLHKFSVVEVGERFFEFPFGEKMAFRTLPAPHTAAAAPSPQQMLQHQPTVHFPIGFVAQLLSEGHLCLMRFTEREALKRRVPLPVPAGVGGAGDATTLSAQLGFKGPRGSKPACCPAPAGIEKVCRCKCNHRRQELYGDLKQKLRTDRKACLAAIRDCVDLQQVAFQLQSARTYQLEMLSYLFGVDPWKYAKNKHEAPPPQQVPDLIRRYKALVQSKEYEQLYKQWMEDQAREKSIQQEIAADITAIGLNVRSNAGASAALTSVQDARIQTSLQQLLPGTPVCVRVKALLGLPSGNEQHIRGVVRRVQVLPKGRAVSVSLNNRSEEFVLQADDVESLLAHDDLRLVRMRSRQWVAAVDSQQTPAGASNEHAQNTHWGSSHSAAPEDSWRDNQSEATYANE